MDRFISSINDFKRITTIMNQVNEKAKEILEHNRYNLHEAIKFTLDFDQEMNDTLEICADLTNFLVQTESLESTDDAVASSSTINQLQEETIISRNDRDKCMCDSEECSSTSSDASISSSISISVSTSSSNCSNEDERNSDTYKGVILEEKTETKRTIDKATITSSPITTLTSTSIYTTTSTSTSTITYTADRQPHVSVLCDGDKALIEKWSFLPSTSYLDVSKNKRSIFTNTTSKQGEQDQEFNPTGK